MPQDAIMALPIHSVPDNRVIMAYNTKILYCYSANLFCC